MDAFSGIAISSIRRANGVGISVCSVDRMTLMGKSKIAMRQRLYELSPRYRRMERSLLPYSAPPFAPTASATGTSSSIEDHRRS